MGKVIDLTGQTFSNWDVIERDISRKKGESHWWCRCKCGNLELKSVRGSKLRNGESKSCGKCQQFEMIGQKFNHLTVRRVNNEYKIEHNIKSRATYYEVECDCEDHTVFTVCGASLLNDHATSCGCIQFSIKKNKIYGFLQTLYATSLRTSNGDIIWKCLCLKCNNECYVDAHSLINGNTKSCGCIKSIGESIIQKVLQENNIQFKKEKTFKDLIGDKNYKYRYDFYLPDYNRLIEFDGIQHYKYQDNGWNNKKQFEKTQERDKIKNEYALSHNIPLVRIPYWERDNITLEMIMGDKYLIKEAKDFEDEEIIF